MFPFCSFVVLYALHPRVTANPGYLVDFQGMRLSRITRVNCADAETRARLISVHTLNATLGDRRH